MDRSGTEDLGITARLMYGYILSNTSVLTAAESSLVLIAGLIPQDVNPQLKVCVLACALYFFHDPALTSDNCSTGTSEGLNLTSSQNQYLTTISQGALNNGATIQEVRAVREIVIHICEKSGMTKLGDSTPGGWGWRSDVANL